MREEEIIELHKKVYALLSKRLQETIAGVGDYELVEEAIPEYLTLQKKDIFLTFPECEYEVSDSQPDKASIRVRLNEGLLVLGLENDICIESYILSNEELNKMSDDKITSTGTLQELEKVFVLLYKQYKDPSFKIAFDNLSPLCRKKYTAIQQELLGEDWKFKAKYLLPEELDKLQELFKKSNP